MLGKAQELPYKWTYSDVRACRLPGRALQTVINLEGGWWAATIKWGIEQSQVCTEDPHGPKVATRDFIFLH